MSHCSGCGSGDIVVDWAAGDTVCRGCGLVLAARLLGEGAEWRTFKDKKEAGQDVLSRAATCPANVAMPPCLQLSTEIARTSATTHAKSLVHAMTRWNNEDNLVAIIGRDHLEARKWGSFSWNLSTILANGVPDDTTASG